MKIESKAAFEKATKAEEKTLKVMGIQKTKSFKSLFAAELGDMARNGMWRK